MKKTLEELHSERKKLQKNSDITLKNMNIIIEESHRATDIALRSNKILKNLDSEFE